jgi:hypothetical protein
MDWWVFVDEFMNIIFKCCSSSNPVLASQELTVSILTVWNTIRRSDC